MATGYVWHELYGWHDTSTHAGFLPPGLVMQPYQHFESPESKQRFHSLVEVSGLADHLVRIVPSPATDEDILRIHTPEHLARIKAESATLRGGDAGDGTSPFGPQGHGIAALLFGLRGLEVLIRLHDQARRQEARVRTGVMPAIQLMPDVSGCHLSSPYVQDFSS